MTEVKFHIQNQSVMNAKPWKAMSMRPIPDWMEESSSLSIQNKLMIVTLKCDYVCTLMLHK